MPEIVIAFDTAVELGASADCVTKLKASGVVSGAAGEVVVVKIPTTPPTVRVVLTAVLFWALDTCLTQIVWPLEILAATLVNIPVQPIE
jgi:hypothetical protein